MPVLASSENKEGTKKIELWTMWGTLNITYFEKKDTGYIPQWSRDYTTPKRAGTWYRKYEQNLLNLKTPEEMHPRIKVTVDSEGEISLNEQGA